MDGGRLRSSYSIKSTQNDIDLGASPHPLPDVGNSSQDATMSER
jgi:hypothetical protein